MPLTVLSPSKLKHGNGFHRIHNKAKLLKAVYDVTQVPQTLAEFKLVTKSAPPLKVIRKNVDAALNPLLGNTERQALQKI